MQFTTLLAILLGSLCSTSIAQDSVVKLWQDKVPGETAAKAPDQITKRKSGSRISKVTDPSFTAYLPAKQHPSKPALLILPGGGYSILAHQHEGSAVAEWAKQKGITAFVLHYRVPKNRSGALQDAQRAIRVIRGQADKWNIATDNIAVLGFSAGGNLAARLSAEKQDTYPKQDAHDQLSSTPNYMALLYPAYMDKGPNSTLSADVAIHKQTPKTFIYTAFDDFSFANGSLVYASALQKAKIPYSLHIASKGGHGFGFGDRNEAAREWPEMFAKWWLFAP